MFIRPLCAAILLGVACGRGVLAPAHGALPSVSDIGDRPLSEDREDPPGASRVRIEINGREAQPESDSATRAAAIELLPAHFREYESPHFIVLSDAAPDDVARLQQRLERAYDEFQRFCRRTRLEPEPLRHKLVTVLFAERTAYRAFAREQDAVTDPTVAGYYAPSHDRAVFYDARTNPSVIDAERALEDMRDDLESLSRRAADEKGHASEVRSHLANYEAHYRRERAKLERFVRQVEAATTVHEAIHQLLYHTGIQSRRLEYPVWLAEGLATTFETDDTALSFGPDRTYGPRQRAFIELLDADRLMPLEALISITPPALARSADAKDIYHQSYALTRWLLKRRPEGMRDYLERLRAEAPGEPSPVRLREIFEMSFGPISTLEQRWLRDERRASRDVRLVTSPKPDSND